VDWDLKPWVITWDFGPPHKKEYGSVMVGPLSGRVYPSGKLMAHLREIVSPEDDIISGEDDDDGSCVVFYQQKRFAEQAAVASFIAGEGGPSQFLNDVEWLEGTSADMPDWVHRAVARRVELVEQGLEMDMLSAAVAKIMDFNDDDDEDEEDARSY
jgi:hypothetical protein